MDYFLIKQQGTISIPKEPKTDDCLSDEPSVRIIGNGFSSDILNQLDKFDYIAGEHLISDRLKRLIEQYLPEQLWRPCVFVDLENKKQKTFWFLPSLPYIPKQVIPASNGIPAAVYVDAKDFAGKSPGIFCVRSSKGSSFLIVHLAIAESILRRGICGLELVRMVDDGKHL